MSPKVIYQLDTDVIIYHLRGKKQLEAKWLESQLVISVITLGELLCGAKKSNRPRKSEKLIKNFINDFNIEVISLDSDLVELYAQHKASLEKKGTKLADFDLLIGVTAVASNFTLATNNKKHFCRISGLKIY